LPADDLDQIALELSVSAAAQQFENFDMKDRIADCANSNDCVDFINDIAEDTVKNYYVDNSGVQDLVD